MNILKTTIAVALLSVTACKKTEGTTGTNVNTPAHTEKSTVEADKAAIGSLVRNMYIWNEKRDYKHEFEPVVKDSYVVGYNLDSHKLYLKELRDSGFFAEEFIANIDKIFKEQNQLLNSGKLKWSDGEMGPFQGDVNSWCSCQDEPAEDAYNKITLHYEDLSSTTAKFYWNWEGFGDNWTAEHYNMRTVKEGGKWKIAYMQGWDYAANLGVE